MANLSDTMQNYYFLRDDYLQQLIEPSNGHRLNAQVVQNLHVPCIDSFHLKNTSFMKKYKFIKNEVAEHANKE